jgi:hypothetical protein
VNKSSGFILIIFSIGDAVELLRDPKVALNLKIKLPSSYPSTTSIPFTLVNSIAVTAS